VGEATMGKNKQVECRICFKPMRSDVVKRHMKIHVKYNQPEKYGVKLQSNEDMCTEPGLVDSVLDKDTITCRNADLSEKPDGSIRAYDVISQSSTELYSINVGALRKAIVKDEQEYKQKIELGREVYLFIDEAKILQESLSKERQAALDLYVKQKQRLDQDITLKPWQEELMSYIKPTDREVIWVIGINGNEGKTWFQQFLKERYGWSKAVTGMDIKAKTSSLCHALRKRSLVTTDIFLFNVGKANTEADVNYDVLEKIKDGHIFASKYDSTELQFKTPNIVIVFSNDKPKINQLAVDRWKIFVIHDNELTDYTRQYTTPKGVMTTSDGDLPIRTEYSY
jgi:hypothetical protein